MPLEKEFKYHIEERWKKKSVRSSSDPVAVLFCGAEIVGRV